MPHEERCVGCDCALEPLEPLRERLPAPVESRAQRLDGHALDAGHHAHDVVGVIGSGGREPEPTVAADDGRDAMERGRARGRIPRELRVVVRVDVDEPRRDHEASCVDPASRRLRPSADRHDPAVPDPDVGSPSDPPGAVDDGAARYEEIEHVPPSTRRMTDDVVVDSQCQSWNDAPVPADPGRLHVVDADSHVLEPPELWRDLVDPPWDVGELSSSRIPRHAIWRPGMSAADVGSLDPNVGHEPNPGASDPRARLADMDRLGVDQALLYPTMFLEHLPLVEDREVAATLASAYNDWIADFCAAAPDRLFPVAVFPVQDVTLAVSELHRVAEMRFRAGLVRPVFVHDRYPQDEYYAPLWDAFATSGLVACVHPSAGPAAPEMDANAPFVERVAANMNLGHPVAELVAPSMDNATLLVGIMSEGLMERLPSLRTTFAHAGIGWLTVTLEKIETYLWLTYAQRPVSLEPEAVFFARENLVTFNAGEGTVARLPDVYERVGAWGSRYPNHDTSTPAVAIGHLEQAGVAPHVVAQLMGGNAARVLGLEVPAGVSPP